MLMIFTQGPKICNVASLYHYVIVIELGYVFPLFL